MLEKLAKSRPLREVAPKKGEELARKPLQKMALFQDMLETEMAQPGIDAGLLDNMKAVKERYEKVIAGFAALDDDQINTLTAYGDAVHSVFTHPKLDKALWQSGVDAWTAATLSLQKSTVLKAAFDRSKRSAENYSLGA